MQLLMKKQHQCVCLIFVDAIQFPFQRPPVKKEEVLFVNDNGC